MTNSLIQKYDEPITIERRAAGSFVNGQLVKGSITNVSATACVMPMSPTEIKILAEGQEDMAGITVYSEVQIKPAIEAAKTNADVILWDGRRWQVKSVHYRPQLAGLEHYKAMALLEDVG